MCYRKAKGEDLGVCWSLRLGTADVIDEWSDTEPKLENMTSQRVCLAYVTLHLPPKPGHRVNWGQRQEN